MNTLQRTWMFFLIALFWHSAAAAVDAPRETAVTGGTGTRTQADAMHITLQIPVSVPLFNGIPVAMVNDDIISLEELKIALTASHEERRESREHREKIDFAKILERILTTRLIVQESRNIGFDEQPEFRKIADANEHMTLKALLHEELTRDVTADPAAVEQRYQAMVVEWKIKSLLFEKEADAQKAAEEIKAGMGFDELAAKTLADKTARGGEQGEYVKPKDLLPIIAAKASALAVGAVSPVIKLDTGPNTQGFTIFRLEDRRFPNDPGAREQAEQSLLADKKNEAAKKYMQALYLKKVTIKKSRLSRLDYTSPTPPIEQLLSDKRVIAEIKGEQPVTVGDLTGKLQEQIYHGIEKGTLGEKANKKKQEVLDAIIFKRLIRSEALGRGLNMGLKYATAVKDYENSVLFSMFIKNVIVPDIKLQEEEIRAYLESHRDEYRYPAMVKLTSLQFAGKDDAASALEKLRKGTDLGWLRGNAPGIIAAPDEDSISFDGRVMMVSSLDENLRKAVEGARAGDFRLYDAGGKYYVLSVQELIPARERPFDQVKDEIAKKMFGERMNRSVEDWAGKLKKAADIKVYIAAHEK